MRYAVIIYTDTTSKAAVSDYMERLHRDKQRECRRQQRRQYFRKQRFNGHIPFSVYHYGSYADRRRRNNSDHYSTAGAVSGIY